MNEAEKRPLRDADCLQPSTFASRKAETTRRADAPRLVSMGRTSHWLKDARGKDVYIDGELFYERDRPMRRYIRLEGDTAFHALFDESTNRKQTERLGSFLRRSVLPSRFEPSGPREVRPV